MQSHLSKASVSRHSRVSHFATLAVVLTPVWLSLAAATGLI
jgi:hypothetical protein